MCAIFGTIGKANLNLIKEISNKQIYRGPDSQNFFCSEDNLVSFGNNRLSVIDKKNGDQPMHSENKKFYVIFNGCIFNFMEIRNFLKKRNIKFKTNCDTEVVANSFQYFGNKSFNYFDGMWAIAIYDVENKNVILSRDYVGQKPLYYAKGQNHYTFSSQLSGIFIDKEIKQNILKKNLIKYYAYSHVPAPNTLFENVFQVEPGNNLIINAKNLNIVNKKYWDIKNGPDYNIFFPKINKDNFRENFKKIINNYSFADRSPALSLSGGIDSNLLLQFINKNTNISSFTLGFDNETYDEAKYVKKNKNGISKEIFYAKDEDLKESFAELSNIINEPIGDSSILPTYMIHKKIKSYSNVCIGGDGGDESFFGYITFDALYIAYYIKKIIPLFALNFLRKIFIFNSSSTNYISLGTKIKKFFEFIHLNNKYLLPSWMSCLNSKDMSILFNKEINEKDLYESSNELFDSYNIFMKYGQMYYFKFYLPMVLAKVDQASMFNSVESRSPFLSKKIINFSLDENVSNLFKLFSKKPLLKKIFKDDIPKEVFLRKKHGFAFPKNILLKDVNFIKKIINYDILTNKTFFEKKYENFLNNNEDCSQYLWNELMLNITLQNLKKIKTA